MRSSWVSAAGVGVGVERALMEMGLWEGVRSLSGEERRIRWVALWWWWWWWWWRDDDEREEGGEVRDKVAIDGEVVVELSVCVCVREREREQERGREKGRVGIPSSLHAVSKEPDLGLDPTDHEILT